MWFTFYRSQKSFLEAEILPREVSKGNCAWKCKQRREISRRERSLARTGYKHYFLQTYFTNYYF